ncbi:transposase [Kitasatospora sp. NPDC049285]|uniref:transposase n=1 Tax=Kitasatospora sp. NPDC049285 TaxID=3157096 RepID=UPI0034340F28
MSERTGWDRGLSVTADSKGLIGHAGAVLLRACADRTGLTAALARVLPRGGTGWRDRAEVVVGLSTAIVLGVKNLLGAEQLQAHQQPLLGRPPSDSTMRRTLAGVDERLLARIGRACGRVRRHVWNLLAARPAGFPWLTVAGKRLTGWIVVDIDTTLITSASNKAGAAVTFKKTFGFHPLGAWCANTTESLAILLRPGQCGQ